MDNIEFVKFRKIPRFNRDIIITEKIDGTNAQVLVPEDSDSPLLFGCRTRWITPEDDNYGFAKWGSEHEAELRHLGPGRHFGEWWGCGIQRNYGLKEKVFSLFDFVKWGVSRPACCGVVPVLYRGPFISENIDVALSFLERSGSIAAPGFMRPEGIVIFQPHSGVWFKKTLDGDEKPKGVKE